MEAFKKILSIFFRVGISLILLFFLFRQVDRKSLLEVIKNSDKPLLFLAFCIFSINYILCIFRWEMLLKVVDISLPLKRIVISFAGGIFFSLFLPSTIGGDFMRSIDLAAHTKKAKEVVATVFLDRLSGYIGLVSLALIALALGWRFMQDKSVMISIFVITALLIAILLVLFNKFFYSRINKFFGSPGKGRIMESISNLHHQIHIFRNHKKMIAKNIVLSLFVQCVTPVTFYFIAKSLGISVNIIYFFVFLPIIGAISLLPISIGGLGLRDATTIFFFAKIGIGKDLAFAMSLLNFSFIIIYSSIGGLIYVLTVHHRRLQYNKPSCLHTSAQ